MLRLANKLFPKANILQVSHMRVIGHHALGWGYLIVNGRLVFVAPIYQHLNPRLIFVPNTYHTSLFVNPFK